jgi:sulfur carrier protein
MKLTVNGEPRETPDGVTLAQVVATVTGQTTGLAAAVNGEVVPRRAWLSIQLSDGDQVEVVTAVQGG